MANNELLKASIRNVIKANGNQEITGDIMQQTLIAIVDALGKGYQFMGVAAPATDPGTTDQKVFYIANGKGVYTNFGGINVDEDGVVLLVYSDAWTKLSAAVSLVDGSVTTPKIANSAVTEEKIADGSITGDKFSPGLTLYMNQQFTYLKQVQVQYGEDPSAAIKSFAQRDNKTALYIKLTNGLLVPANTNGETVSGLYSYGNTVRKVLFDGTNWSDVEIQSDIIDTAHIKDYAVTHDKLAAGAVGTGNIMHSSIDGIHIQDQAIPESKLVPSIQDLLDGAVQRNKLSPVLQEIDLTGTNDERKAKLDKFETDWKTLTNAANPRGARFIGKVNSSEIGVTTVLLRNNVNNNTYEGIIFSDDFDAKIQSVSVDIATGSITITPLFSHLEAITIKTGNTTTDKADNKAAIQAYIDNLTALGIDTTKGYIIPVYVKGIGPGFLGKMGNNTVYYMGVMNMYGASSFGISVDAGGGYSSYKLQTETDNSLATISKQIVGAINEVNTLAKGVKAFGALNLRAGNSPLNKTALDYYLLTLTNAGVNTDNGYAVPVRITGNSQEYHGMLNIGTGVLLSGVVTDMNENHHYPFNISTTDGVITFNESNYFLEKTSNEVTEMLDAIKYSHTSVPFTDTTLSNKAQLEVFLSKVPDATVMHCTYKEIWAGTLHKINGDWYGLLVKNTNSPADNINIKLSADGTVITSNSAQ